MNAALIFAVLIAFNVVAIVVNAIGARRQRSLQVDVVDVDAMFAPTAPTADWRPNSLDRRAAVADWSPADNTGARLVLEATGSA
jgi:hypothetical protein